MTNEKSHLKTGIAGSLLAAICCFTPFLVILFGFAGVSTWLGWIDYALFPLMFASMGVIANALYIRAGRIGFNPKLVIVLFAVAFSVLIISLKFHFAFRISIAAVACVAGYVFYLHRQKAKLTT